MDDSKHKNFDACCDEFESTWKSGNSPNIESFLERVSSERQADLFKELIQIELWWRRGEVPSPNKESYLQRFSGYSDIINAAFVDYATPTMIPTDDLAPHDQQALPTSTLLSIPGVIGRYRIDSEIDRGSFGRVLKAYDEQLERWVAIKVQLPGVYRTQSEVDEFLKEARRVAQLEHPHIVPVYDAGQLEDGTCYVVSKLISGGSLKSVLETSPPSMDESCLMMMTVAGAIEHAHQRGFVHRDLKPANILLDDHGQPYVCDFGLALHEDEQLDRKREISGSPAYMSPEQVRGETLHIDGRSDLWSLGVIFYELLTGKRPFRGKSTQEIWDSITDKDPKPLRMINPGIPQHLERVVLKCLEKYPRERYQTAGDLAKEIHTTENKNSFTLTSFVILAVVMAFTFATFYFSRNGSPEFEASTTPKTTSSPLESDLDVRIWNDNVPQRRGLSISENSLPLQPGDQIRIEGILSEPAYPYLVWISSTGEVSPVYPWTPGDWSSRPENETKVTRVSLPEIVDQAWPITGPAGMESLLMLVRDTPLPKDIDLKSMIGPLPPQHMQQSNSVVWFVNGAPINDLNLPSSLVSGNTRAPQFYNPQQVNAPVLNAQAELYAQLKEHFKLIQTASFANSGLENQ